MLEVFIEMRPHDSIPAMIQKFVNTQTGEVVSEKELVGYTLQEVFSDSCGRLIMRYKKLTHS